MHINERYYEVESFLSIKVGNNVQAIRSRMIYRYLKKREKKKQLRILNQTQHYRNSTLQVQPYLK